MAKFACRVCGLPQTTREKIERHLVQHGGGFQKTSDWISRQPEFVGLRVSKSAIHRHMRHAQQRDSMLLAVWPSGQINNAYDGRAVAPEEVLRQDTCLVIRYDALPDGLVSSTASVIATMETEESRGESQGTSRIESDGKDQKN